MPCVISLLCFVFAETETQYTCIWLYILNQFFSFFDFLCFLVISSTTVLRLNGYTAQLASILWPQKRGLSDQILNMPSLIERLYLLNVDLTIFTQCSTRFQLQDDVRRAHDSLEVSLVPFLRIFIIVGTNILNQLLYKISLLSWASSLSSGRSSTCTVDLGGNIFSTQPSLLLQTVSNMLLLKFVSSSPLTFILTKDRVGGGEVGWQVQASRGERLSVSRWECVRFWRYLKILV